jgi:GDP-L-fucose synthase
MSTKHMDRIFIAGARGLVGSAVSRCLEGSNLLTPSSSELDLTNQEATHAFFEETRPTSVIMAAAKVGGIWANKTYPAEFIYQNLAMETNVIHAAQRFGVERLIFLGSSCIYPRDCPQPMKEEHLLSGPLESTNRPYALAKIAGIEMCWAYNRQHGCQFLAVMPTNLYGPEDSYHPENSHVIPGIVRKMHEAKEANAPHVKLWGSGTVKREFLHSDDLARAIVHLIALDDENYRALTQDEAHPPLVNIGYGEDFTIAELAEMLRETVGFKGEILWDSSRPDGTPRKLLDSRRIRDLCWSPSVSLREGLRDSYEDFRARYAMVTS